MKRKQQNQIIIDYDTISFDDIEYKRYYLEDGTPTDYYANHHGSIVSTKRKNWLIMEQQSKRGYHVVGLYINRSVHYVTVHKIVARIFIGDKPEEGMEIDHIDTIKSNNHVSNLEWVYPKTNIRRAWLNGLCTKRHGDKHHNVKYSDDQIIDALLYMRQGNSILETSIKTEIPTKYLYRVVSGDRRKPLLDKSEVNIQNCPWLYEHPEFRVSRK